MSYIYMIGGSHPPYKIGRSDDVAGRMKDLQTAHPTPLRIIMVASTDTPAQHEKAVHFALRDHALTGEWFNCDFSVAAQAMKDVGLCPSLTASDTIERWVSPDAVVQWLGQMECPPFFATEERCADMLGITPAAITSMKHAGMDRRTRPRLPCPAAPSGALCVTGRAKGARRRG